MKQMKRTKLYTILLLFVVSFGFAQQKKVQASIDSAKIKIGSQAKLTLKAIVDSTARVNFPEGKNFGQLEVLESYPVDTIKKGALYELIKEYGLTQFDSGRYVIPRLPVVINNQTVQTDSLKLEVAEVKVDTLKQKMYDIKPVLYTQSKSNWWIWLLAIAALAGIGYDIWWYFKKRKVQPKAVPEVFVSPIERATKELRNLEKKQLLERGAVKEYYSEMADIARLYIEEAIHIPAMESTTGAIIEAMRLAVRKRKMALSQETFEQLEKVLRNADMVKFAKSRPLDFEIAEDRSRIEKTIVVIDRSIPEEKEEDDLHTRAWEEAQRRKKEQKRRRVIMISSIAGGILLLLGITYFAAKDYVQANILGYPTKELLEGEWVKSEYGNPGITIETPKVLRRMDAAKALPKDAMAMLKDMNMFGYGTLFDDIYIIVSTSSFKQQTDVKLEQAVDGMLKTWETQGARNIVTKTEEFSTPQGIQGIRSFGTMTLPHAITKQPVRAYYELFLFKQQSGLQQVIILQREGDEYATQILERVKNSIELRNLNR